MLLSIIFAQLILAAILKVNLIKIKNNMIKSLLFASFLFFLFFFSSCLPANKLYYFNDQRPSVQNLDSLSRYTVIKVQKLDKLNITISSTDPVLTNYLNPFGGPSSSGQQPSSGYLVNNQGSIEFPLLGKVAVLGLTSVEIATLLKDKLSYYYKDLFINVNITGKVYFLSGKSGSSILLISERLTIFEAIAQAGAIDPYDIKNDVWLIREDSGQRHFVKLDLNSKKIFESPYYFMRNNDLVYIKPIIYSSFLNPSNPIRVFVTLVGALSTILLLITKL